MTTKEIIQLAKSFQTHWKTNDPFLIAKRLGIEVLFRPNSLSCFTAHTLQIAGYPTIISINDDYTDFSKKILCAHELGHALLHDNCINHFAITSSNAMTNIEFEANLFAVALLADNDFLSALQMPLEKTDNYLLKTILEYNLQKK